VELPTQAGLPIFDDDNDDVSWLNARTPPAPPPPPFEPHPERPLFAPEPESGAPARRPRPGGGPSTATGSDFWPWDTSTGRGAGTGTGTGLPPVADDDEEVPGRSWMRLALGIAVGLLLLVAIVVAWNLGRGKTPLGAEPNSEPTSSSPGGTTSATPAAPLTGLVASDFDPQAAPPEENPTLAPLAVDGDPTTDWHTETYKQQLGPGGLKTGVGLVIDLGGEHDVSAVDLTLNGTTGVQLFVTDTAPTTLRGLTPVQTLTAGAQQNVTLDQPVTGRYVVVWLTSLPAVNGGFRGEVFEVVVRG
jgi:hypothetical protein